MVALNRFLLTSLVACIGYISVASAQQMQPRISGLETNDKYMQLLTEDNNLTIQEDSITVVVESLRKVYRDDPNDATANREQIISLENKLFELRARKASVLDSINIIEQDWVLDNMGSVAAPEPNKATLLDTSNDVKHIFESPNVKMNLSDVDYKNLIKSENLEVKAENLSATFVANYDNMLSLSKSYDSVVRQSEAEVIRERFDSLALINVKLLEELDDTWGYIYDNKSFAYSMVMELLGFDDVLQQEAELMRRSQAEISSKQQSTAADALLSYRVQKSSMMEFEISVAQKLGLKNIVDSLTMVAENVSLIEKVSPPELALTERYFIAFESVSFVTKPKYTAANPIPETALYDKGTVYRIFVGAFQVKQPVSTFRNTVPVSHLVNSDNRHAYYIGGFETYAEAVEAQEMLKKRGFRAPQIVEWRDGEQRNLTINPYETNSSYRLDIVEASTLPDGAAELVKTIAPTSSITKVGTDKFVIMTLDRSSQADSLATQLQQLDPQLKINVSEVE